MKVLLIKPTAQTDAITPPLGLGYLATGIRNRHKVSIVDGPLARLNEAKFGQMLDEFRPDVVGSQMLTMDMAQAWRYFSVAKDRIPGVITVAGGPQPSGEPVGTMHWFGSKLDYAFIGEAEFGFSKLLEAVEESYPKRPDSDILREIPALIWREDPFVRVNAIRREPDLDALGFPAWDIIQPHKYPPAPHAAYAKNFPVGCVTATRGCPYDCDFCGAGIIQGRKLRTRSVEHVLEEIGLLVNKYGMKEIHIVDDNFTYNRTHVMNFCEQKTRRFPSITWTCPNGVRLDSLDPELLDVMKKSGCHSLAMGIESGSQRVLNLARKKQTIGLIREKVELIKRSGMDPIGFFIFGFPGESLDEMRETIQFSLELPLKRAHYMFYHPIPGTYSYKRVLDECPECVRKVESSFEVVAYADRGLTEKQLKDVQREAFLKFYLRPYQFSSLFTSIRHPKQVYYILRRIVRWMIFS